MRKNHIGRKYARSLYNVASDNLILEVNVLLRAIKEFNFLQTPKLKPRKKLEILSNIGVHTNLCNLCAAMLSRKRDSMIVSSLEEYLEIAKKHQGIIDVLVESYSTLTMEQEEELKNKILEIRKDANSVNLSIKLNKNLIGGMIVRIENKIIDLSILGKLNTCKSTFIKALSKLN